MTDRRAALVEKVARCMGEAISLWLHEHPGCVLEDVDTAYIATAAIDLIRAETLEEVASPAFLRPLVEEQSKGEWDDKTIDEDVKMFAAALRALKEQTHDR